MENPAASLYSANFKRFAFQTEFTFQRTRDCYFPLQIEFLIIDRQSVEQVNALRKTLLE